MNDAIVDVVFCDDVRQELGGKISAMGIYRGFLRLHAPIPYLPKFVALVQLQLPTSLAGKQLSVRVLDADTELASMQITIESPSVSWALVEAGVPDAIFMTVPMEFVGFPAKAGMRVSVDVTSDGLNFRSATLVVVGPLKAPTVVKAAADAS